MKGVCGIDINSDRTFISFAALRRSGPVFLDEIEVEVPWPGPELAPFLKQNGDLLIKQIRGRAAQLSLEVAKVYLKLPWSLEKACVVEELVPLKKRKKITRRDLAFAKKYLENTALDWDDFCLHHFPLQYGVEGRVLETPPAGLWTKRIRLKSLLLTTKDRLYTQVREIFANLEIGFGGFVSSRVAVFTSSFKELAPSQVKAVISVGWGASYLVVARQGVIDSVQEFDFGLRQLIERLSQYFSIPFSLAQEIFDRYVFLSRPLDSDAPGRGQSGGHKEVSLRDGTSYINLSIHTLNSLIKDYLQSQIGAILEQIEELKPEAAVVLSFVGRLNKKQGFYDFVRGFVPQQIKPPQAADSSSSFGCLAYGMSPFLENSHQSRRSFREWFFHIYREYF